MPFCVFIPSYNNVKNDRYIHNLNSILRQKYSNYRILYIDDASPDNTAKFVEEYVSKLNLPEGKFTLIRNEKNLKALENIYYASHNFCKDHELFMIMDGDDYLIGDYVFQSYNLHFQKEDLWHVYSNFMFSSHPAPGFSHPIDHIILATRQYRKNPGGVTHKYVFYNKLFRMIKK